MGVTYDKKQREHQKRDGGYLVTIDIDGGKEKGRVTIQGPAGDVTAKWLHGILNKYIDRVEAEDAET